MMLKSKGFVFSHDTGDLYIKQSDTSGDWSNPYSFPRPARPCWSRGRDGEKRDRVTRPARPCWSNGADGADGAPFVYDDFTTEQLALLVGPQGDQDKALLERMEAKGDKGDQGIQGARRS